ncbi:MAG: hypothetical protein KAS32_24150 [Candidatus Peribacteraceae bacterium]|nr:hypothetical protein [Candidatus Peribacteraceae bacterium]
MKTFNQFVTEAGERQKLIDLLAKSDSALKDDEETEEMVGDAPTRNVKSALKFLQGAKSPSQKDIDKTIGMLGEAEEMNEAKELKVTVRLDPLKGLEILGIGNFVTAEISKAQLVDVSKGKVIKTTAKFG